MNELLHAAFSGVNVLPTGMILLVVIYWFTVMLGALDMGFLDFDVEADGEADVEIEVDLSVEAGTDVPFYLSVLSFFNLGKVPFMVFMTFLALPFWFMAIVGNHYLGIDSILIGILALSGYFFVSLFIAKFCTMPFVVLFRKMEESEEDKFNPIGKICVASLPLSSSRIGQVTIDAKGSYIINAKSPEGKSLQKGEQGLVIEFNEALQCYIVEPYQGI